MGRLGFWFFMMSSWSAAFWPWWYNGIGVATLVAGDKVAAYKSFTRAIELDPLNPVIQLNLGRTFEVNEEWDKAEATYRSVQDLGPVPTNAVDFNLGNVYAARKKIPEALASYQKALDEPQPRAVSPAWGRVLTAASARDVKKNIELLFAKGGGQGDGKGQSDQNDPSKSKDDKDQDKKDDKTNQQKREESLKKPQPDQDKGKEQKAKPFQSQELTPDDVKRILDEIKNQEQNIRAQEYDKKAKDGARGGKDW